MGNCGSKSDTKESTEPTKENSSPKNNGSDAARNVSAFLSVVMNGYHEYVTSHCDDKQETKEILALVFMNSCVDVVHNNFRMKSDVAVSTVRTVASEKKLALFEEMSSKVEEHAVDDGLSRLLNAWLQKNKEGKTSVSKEVAAEMMSSIDITLHFESDISFCQLVIEFYGFHANPKLDEIFLKHSGGLHIMQGSEYCSFLNDVQGTSVTKNDAHEKIRSRFGGAMTRYSFKTYISRAHSNFILDPQRSRDVWQDMMEPLPNYMVRTQSVQTQEELSSALSQGVRAFVLHCTDVDDVIMSGEISLHDILTKLKNEAFDTNNYPVILCFDPAHVVSKELQERIATEVQKSVGQCLARGMMFDGANINDPQYSPAALQKKFLLMGNQAPLRPFVGFLVADMNRVGLGVRVTDVKNSTPAAKAGIVKDDWLTHINGEQIQDKQHLKTLLVKLSLGEEFTMKKENLEEVRVVVGGAIPEDDKSEAKHLSDMIYLKFSEDSQPITENAPWETSTTCTEDVVKSPLKKRDDLQNHLVFVSDAENLDGSPDGKITTDASNMGIQFIDSVSSHQLHAWSMGKFAENAHCGYVLKSFGDRQISTTLKIVFLSPPQHIQKATLKNVTTTVYGDGESTVEEDKSVTLKVVDEMSVVSFTLEYDVDGTAHTMIGSFPSHLVRPGYRGMPVIYEDNILKYPTGSPYDVCCFIETQK